MQKNLGIVGLWHLGCVLAASWSQLNQKVYGFDYDGRRIENLKKGIPPLFEPSLEETIRTNMEKGILNFSASIDSLSVCDFVFLCYDTPVRDDDSSDTSILEKAVLDVRKVMKDGAILIVSSQSPVGFCAYLRNLLRDQNDTLDLAYSPENLRLGEAINCYLNPGRIILGTADAEAEQKCLQLFQQITSEILCMNLASAEMVKHGINSFLATSIVFTNNLADICDETNARIDDVVRGMKSDPRIGQKAYLAPGIGFSGGTLGRDLKVLSSKNESTNGYAKLFGFIHESNNERKQVIAHKIEKLLKGIANKNVGVLGLTYKPGTSTLRRSLPLEIIALLIGKRAQIRAYDPMADYSELGFQPKFQVANSIADAAKDADILVVLTDWNDFKEFDWLTVKDLMRSPRILDTRNCLNEHRVRESGLSYYSIGRG